MNAHELARLRENARNNTYQVHGDIGGADCVIGFSFGYRDGPKGVLPGISNQQLAAYIEQRLVSLPLILQFEINDALQTSKAAFVIYESRKRGEYLGAREVAAQALLFMEQRGWKSAVIVTHPAMVARIDAVSIKLGISTITPPGLKIAYDSKSAQPWTRNKESWGEREDGAISECFENHWL